MDSEIELKLFLIVGALALIGYCIFSPIQCAARWRGMETSWGPIQGCLVKTKSGEWVPDDRIREVSTTN